MTAMRRLMLCMGVMLVSAQGAWAAQGEVVARPYGTVQGMNYGYWEYLPLGYDDAPDAEFPLVVFLHGVGEAGNGSAADLQKIMNLRAPPRLARDGRDFPFILVSPQRFNAFIQVNEIDAIIEWAKRSYRVDPKRIYLTGISAGGIQSWAYAAVHYAKLAAVVPIAGNGNGVNMCPAAAAGLPVWAFHGTADGTVSQYGSINPVKAMNTTCTPAANPPALLTLYPGVGHDSWGRTYDGSAGHDIYTWMLGYSL
jgi:predicted peptidase